MAFVVSFFIVKKSVVFFSYGYYLRVILSSKGYYFTISAAMIIVCWAAKQIYDNRKNDITINIKNNKNNLFKVIFITLLFMIIYGLIFYIFSQCFYINSIVFDEYKYNYFIYDSDEPSLGAMILLHVIIIWLFFVCLVIKKTVSMRSFTTIAIMATLAFFFVDWILIWMGYIFFIGSIKFNDILFFVNIIAFTCFFSMHTALAFWITAKLTAIKLKPA